MAEPKKNLKIRFEGRLDNLVINYGGKILYSYKREKNKETGRTAKQKAAQSKTAITAALCSQMNRIPALKHIWRNWPSKERKPYRNMLAANIRHTSPEHLTIRNKVSPKTQYEIYGTYKSLDTSGLKFQFDLQKSKTLVAETGKKFSVVAIICLFNPIDKKKDSYKLFTLCEELENFDPGFIYDIEFPFEAKEQKEVGEYERCLLFSTILFSELTGSPNKWASLITREIVLRK